MDWLRKIVSGKR